MNDHWTPVSVSPDNAHGFTAVLLFQICELQVISCDLSSECTCCCRHTFDGETPRTDLPAVTCDDHCVTTLTLRSTYSPYSAGAQNEAFWWWNLDNHGSSMMEPMHCLVDPLKIFDEEQWINDRLWINGNLPIYTWLHSLSDLQKVLLIALLQHLPG